MPCALLSALAAGETRLPEVPIAPIREYFQNESVLRTKHHMNFSLHKDFSELDPNAWNDLLSGSITDVPFLRYEYLSAWWNTRGGGEWPSAERAH